MSAMPYSYAVFRAVPRVDRGEFINVGVILHCRPAKFLRACVALDETRLLALDPHAPLEELRQHLAAMERICAGGVDAGPLGGQPTSDRFHWLTATRSTVLQTSVPHCGMTTDPAQTLEHLMERMVRVAR